MFSVFSRSEKSLHRNVPAVEIGGACAKKQVMQNKILVVDDDAELVELLSSNLARSAAS